MLICSIMCFSGTSATSSDRDPTTEQLIGTDVSPKLCDALHVWWKCTRDQTTLFQQQNGTNTSLSFVFSLNVNKQTFSLHSHSSVMSLSPLKFEPTFIWLLSLIGCFELCRATNNPMTLQPTYFIKLKCFVWHPGRPSSRRKKRAPRDTSGPSACWLLSLVSIAGLPAAFNLPLPVYTPGWRKPLWD